MNKSKAIKVINNEIDNILKYGVRLDEDYWYISCPYMLEPTTSRVLKYKSGKYLIKALEECLIVIKEDACADNQEHYILNELVPEYKHKHTNLVCHVRHIPMTRIKKQVTYWTNWNDEIVDRDEWYMKDKRYQDDIYVHYYDGNLLKIDESSIM